MTAAPQRTLIALADAGAALSLGVGLRRRGHQVTAVASAADLLLVGAHDVIVIDAALPDRSGFEVASELVRRGSRAALVLLADAPSFEECRDAMRLGFRDVLAKPCDLEQLVAAVEGAWPKPALPSRETATFARRHGANADGLDSALRDLLAELVRWSFGPSTRARIASAVHEVVDNVLRHAYPSREGSFELRAELEGGQLLVTVADQGVGLDTVALALGPVEHVELTSNGGLSRASALAENLTVESTPGRGTRVTLAFASYRVQFDHEDAVDLSELDYLTPEMSKRVLAGLSGDCEPQYNLSPALAVSIGRMLAGPTTKQTIQKALWS
ncbi:MAG: ATP-binding protein [Planctomycetes bacterium]|nr:ATP-binding protein [Planctomycetota bacterium]